MKIISISLLCALTVLSCGSSTKNPWQEREIVFYVESKSKGAIAVEASPEAIVLPSGSPTPFATQALIPTTGEEKFKKAYGEISAKMENLGLIRDDLGDVKKDYDFLRKGLKSGRFEGLDEKLDLVLKKIDSIRVDADFIVAKDQKVRAALAKMQPKGEQLNKIESKLVRAEQLKQEQKFVEVNKVYSGILKILGY